MMGVVVITHGNLAYGLVEAAEMTLGPQEMLRAIPFSRREGQEELAAKTAQALGGMRRADGILILTDMRGGSAYNVGRRLMDDHGAQLITGVNLAVLLEVLILRKNLTDPKEVAALATSKGRDGIVCLEGKKA